MVALGHGRNRRVSAGLPGNAGVTRPRRSPWRWDAARAGARRPARLTGPRRPATISTPLCRAARGHPCGAWRSSSAHACATNERGSPDEEFWYNRPAWCGLAIAAAKVVEAGHDVVGVHGPVSFPKATPGVPHRFRAVAASRIEDAGTRRAPNIGIRSTCGIRPELSSSIVTDFAPALGAGTPTPSAKSVNEFVKFQSWPLCQHWVQAFDLMWCALPLRGLLPTYAG